MSDAAAAAKRLLAAALQVDETEVDEGAAIGLTERWDSLAHMRLVLALEEHLNAELDTEEMLGIENFSDVVTFLQTRQA